MATTYAACPTEIVEAPIEVVWKLLTNFSGWGGFYDVRVNRVEPPGPAVVGQRMFGESGPRGLHLRVSFEFTRIDEPRRQLESGHPIAAGHQGPRIARLRLPRRRPLPRQLPLQFRFPRQISRGDVAISPRPRIKKRPRRFAIAVETRSEQAYRDGRAEQQNPASARDDDAS